MRIASPFITLLLTAPCLAATPVRKQVPASAHALVAVHTLPHAAIGATTHTIAVTRVSLHTTPHATLEPQHSHTPAHHDTPSTGMDPERATQIQAALIKAGYLTGPASGTWDAESIAAMQKFQDDNGWQTKIVPDARALIKLGLGPHPDSPATPASPPQ